MTADEEQKACTGGGESYINPCLYRKANVQLSGRPELKGIYVYARWTVITSDGDPIALENRKFKVFSITRN